MTDKQIDKFVEDTLKKLKELAERKTKEQEIAEKIIYKVDTIVEEFITKYRKALVTMIQPDDPLFDESPKLTKAEIEECLPDAECLRFMINKLTDKTVELAIEKHIDNNY